MDIQSGKALLARVFYQSFSEIERLSVSDYAFFVSLAEKIQHAQQDVNR